MIKVLLPVFLLLGVAGCKSTKRKEKKRRFHAPLPMEPTVSAMKKRPRTMRPRRRRYDTGSLHGDVDPGTAPKKGTAYTSAWVPPKVLRSTMGIKVKDVSKDNDPPAPMGSISEKPKLKSCTPQECAKNPKFNRQH